VWRIVHDHVERAVVERHVGIVGGNGRVMPRINVHANDRAGASPPKSATVHGSIQDSLRTLSGIEAKQAFQKFGIFSFPY
jgi:hypothetical protein